jgi:hypothetical protein
MLASTIVTVTGLSQATRKTIAALIESHGGVFSPDLRKSSTVLIAGPDATSSNKYKYSLLWGIPGTRVFLTFFFFFFFCFFFFCLFSCSGVFGLALFVH